MIEVVEQASQATNLPKTYVATGGLVFVLLILFFGFGASFLCNLLGFLWPAYASFKAIETKEEGYDTQWLTYWVVYSFLNIIENFSDYLLQWV